MPDRIPLTIAELNRMSAAEFTAALGDLFEHSAWVAERAAARRPFGTARDLHDAMMDCVHQAGAQMQRDLVCAHPELAGQEAMEGSMTASSGAEQGRLGLTQLSHAEREDLAALNAQYRARFGWPYVVALWRHATRDSVVADLRHRMDADADSEFATTLREIGYVTQARLDARLRS